MLVNNENENTVKYGVFVDGKMIYSSAVQLMAENFRNTLPEDQRADAQVKPVTTSGKEILLG